MAAELTAEEAKEKLDTYWNRVAEHPSYAKNLVPCRFNVKEDERDKFDMMCNPPKWGHYEWNVDPLKDLIIVDGHDEKCYEKIFVIEPMIFCFRMKQVHSNSNKWDIIMGHDGYRLKKSIDMQCQFKMTAHVRMPNRGEFFSDTIRMQDYMYNKQIQTRKMPQSLDNCRFCSKFKTTKIDYPRPERLFSVHFWIYLQEFNYKGKKLLRCPNDLTKVRDILEPLMYTKEDVDVYERRCNNNLQKENDKLKKQLEQMKEQMQKLEMAKHKQEDESFKVNKWLNDNNLGMYSDMLIEAGFDDKESILDITHDDLKEIGIDKLGKRKKIVKAIAKLNEGK